MGYKILLVEDEIRMQEIIKDYFNAKGCEVICSYDGEEALDMFEENSFDLILLDVMMPKLNGFSVCKKIRTNIDNIYNKKDIPIIFITAKSDEDDNLYGYEIGSDDYVTKPFVPMELLARVSSQLRRYSRYLNVILDQQHENSYVVGGLELNLDTKQVTVEGKIIKVTPIEFKILQLLMEYPGKVFSADNIYESVWQEDAISTDTVMVHVRNLREKIEIDPKNPRYLKVVWGVGYKIEK